VSLKAFHIFFIFLSILLAFGFAYWAIENSLAAGDSLNMALGISSVITGLALIFYLIRFIAKMRRLTAHEK